MYFSYIVTGLVDKNDEKEIQNGLLTAKEDDRRQKLTGVNKHRQGRQRHRGRIGGNIWSAGDGVSYREAQKISQGSVVTHLRCGGIFSDSTIISLSEPLEIFQWF